MTSDEFDGAMSVALSIWPQWKAHQGTFAAADRLLADLDGAQVLAALDSLAVESPAFFPGLGAIRVRALELAHPDGGAPSPDEAWGEVKGEIARVGYRSGTDESDRVARFTHPAIEAVVAAMSWRELCLSENEVADRAHFVRLYAERVTRLRTDRAMPPTVAEMIRLAQAPADQLPDGPRRILDVVPDL